MLGGVRFSKASRLRAISDDLTGVACDSAETGMVPAKWLQRDELEGHAQNPKRQIALGDSRLTLSSNWIVTSLVVTILGQALATFRCSCGATTLRP